MAVKFHDLLGINSRQKYTSLNSSKSKSYAYSKLRAKQLLAGKDVPVPELYAIFDSAEQVDEFSWNKMSTSFAIKPIDGNAGKGILVIRKKSEPSDKWTSFDGKVLSTAELKLHIKDILEGQYSTYGTTHHAFVEERIPIHPTLKKYVTGGTPDIRVIVFNKVPVMAMLRLPTAESEGRANLHQGAIGVGIDIASGVTLAGVHHGKAIQYLPGTKKKLNGIKLPKWNTLLTVAVKAAEAAGLNYAGVDLFVHPEKGPMVVELNASPGLSIQVANKAGLKRRLERIEDLDIRDAEHGVRVGKALFAEWFADKVKAQEGLEIINIYETVQVRGVNKRWEDVLAKMNTGTKRSSIDKTLAKELGLLSEDTFLWEEGTTVGQKRRIIEITIKLKDRKISTNASVVDKSKKRVKLQVGWGDLVGFVVNPHPLEG